MIAASRETAYFCPMQLSREDIATIRNYFKDKPVVKAFVFGSFAKNTATDESDVDILVELDYSQHIGLRFINMKFDLEEKLQKQVDLVSSNAISKHLHPFIHNDKHLIYER